MLPSESSPSKSLPRQRTRVFQPGAVEPGRSTSEFDVLFTMHTSIKITAQLGQGVSLRIAHSNQQRHTPRKRVSGAPVTRVIGAERHLHPIQQALGNGG